MIVLHTDANFKNLELTSPQFVTATELDQQIIALHYYINVYLQKYQVSTRIRY